MKNIKLLSYAVASLMITPAASSVFAAPQDNVDARRAAFEMMQLNAEPLKGPRQYAKGDVWERLRVGFQMSEVNPELVRKHEQYYASRAQYFNRTLARGSKYLYFITDEVERRKMPTEIALLPVIESAFVTKAKSHVGASGLWQFMPATGTQYGLEQTWWYDGRRDVYDSTRAALDYLEYLNNMFGDWSLALASYNWGEGSVSKAVKRARAAGLSPVYENLKMPNETRNYVPKLLAVRNLIDNPQNFGLKLEPLPNRPYFEAVNVGKHMDTALAANFAEISMDEFYALNPGFNLPVYADKNGRKMLIPVEKVSAFNKNMRKWGNKPLLSWDIYTAQGTESVAALAANAGMSVADFRDINGIRGNALQRGRPILLAKGSSPQVTPNFTSPQLAEPTILVAQTQLTPTPAQTKVVLDTPRQTPARTDIDIIVAKNEPTITPQRVTQPAPVLTAAVTPTETKPVVTVAVSDDALQSFVQQLALPNTTEEKPQLLAQNDDEAARKAADERINRTLSGWNKEVAEAQKPAATPAEATKVATAGTSSYKVQGGDTLYKVAREHNMKVEELRALNALADDNITVGRVLKVAATSNTPAGVITVAGKKPATAAKAKETVYTVQKGDSWYKVAQKYGIDHKELMKRNTQNASSALKPGQKIKVTLIDL